jgi:hypothetical protein
MNNAKRLLLGVFSSLLLAAGFVRAADRLDPMSAQLSQTTSTNFSAAPACGGTCGSVCDMINSQG